VAIEYRWAEDQNSRLPALAADLIKRRVAVIAATSTPAALAAKAATSIIPIVFEIAAAWPRREPQPTWWQCHRATQINVEVGPKRLELLHKLMPAARAIRSWPDATVVSMQVSIDLRYPKRPSMSLHPVMEVSQGHRNTR
jgi:putative ABC transport system substrate-binding protein